MVQPMDFVYRGSMPQPVRSDSARVPLRSRPSVDADESVRRLAERALSRAAGAPLVGGNALELLIDAEANFATWLAAIGTARQRILLENYIVRDDRIGRAFRDALIERAAAGVEICVIYDWLGCLGQSHGKYWRALREAGAQVRVYNPFRLHDLFGWIGRDHRKLLVVDRDVAFLGGLCISAKWLGQPDRGIAPWRDTAVALRGPALLDCEHAFAEVWGQLGAALRETDMAAPASAGDVDVRVIATQPDTARMFRLDQLIAGLAQRTLWLADAYFVGVSPYVQALMAAAADGVDVRLIVPGASDLPLVRNISLSCYRPLLQAGIRVFEWNGSMMHAKTAVADGRWARVGSSNLNIASWIGNCEIDIAVENVEFAALMEDQYRRDLENATEIVLTRPRRRVDTRPRQKTAGGSTSRAAAGALRLAHSMGSAFGRQRVLENSRDSLLPWWIGILLAIAIAAAVWPWLIAWPLAALSAWIAVGMLARFVHARRTKIAAPAATAADAPPAPPDPLRD